MVYGDGIIYLVYCKGTLTCSFLVDRMRNQRGDVTMLYEEVW